MRVTVGNLKGGVAKTTTAVYLAHGLAQHSSVALVDADPRQSATRWSETAEGFEFPIFPWSDSQLARRIQQIADQYDHLIIDTPPELPEIIRPAMAVCDLLVVTVSPSPIEINRLGDTFVMASEMSTVHDFEVIVLLAKVRAHTLSAQAARQVLADRQIPAFQAEILLREQYVMAYGTKIRDLAGYAGVLDELHAEVRR
jgi:chromosome partitioning protein